MKPLYVHRVGVPGELDPRDAAVVNGWREFDHYASKNGPVRALVIVPNDEVFDVQRVVGILGRLVKYNLGHMMPNLRQTPMLLTQLQFSRDAQQLCVAAGHPHRQRSEVGGVLRGDDLAVAAEPPSSLCGAGACCTTTSVPAVSRMVFARPQSSKASFRNVFFVAVAAEQALLAQYDYLRSAHELAAQNAPALEWRPRRGLILK